MSKPPNVFFIGFNKTATSSFHHLFHKSKYQSAHLRCRGINIAKKFDANFKKKKPLLTDLHTCTVFSDLVYISDQQFIEGNKYFETLHRQYPNSYFILQTRNEDAWIKSRMVHAPNHRGGSFASRCQRVLKLQNKAQLEEYWRAERRAHHEKVINYFNGNSQFMIYDLDTDRINKLVKHVSNDYTLFGEHWRVKNRTAGKHTHRKVKK